MDRRKQAWLDAAASCGLDVMEASDRSGVKAWVGLLEVRIEPCDGDRQRARIVVVIPGPLDFIVVRIRAEAGELPQDEEIEIGDAPFDRRFSIKGPRRQVFALLDAWTRHLLLRVSSECRLAIHTGSLHAEMSDEQVPHILPLLLDLGRQLTESLGADIPRHLAENVKRDPEAEVRLQNLLLLIREHPGDPATLEALRKACSDPSPHIRLHTAKELGAEGYDVLLELAELRENDAVSAQAIAMLGPELPAQRAATILDFALAKGRIQTARACLEALGQNENAAAAEPPLIQALEHKNVEVRAAAVSALARVGSAAAVLPLMEMAKRFRDDRDLRRAARQAIEEIQSRLPDASRGQLSLAKTEVGQLSLAQSEAGQLSLAKEQGGQLSLNDDEEELKPAPGGAV